MNEGEEKPKSGKSATPLHKMAYLEDCLQHACEALQRAENHRLAMRDEMRNAGEWLAKVWDGCSTTRAYKRLLKRYKIGLRMAYYCRQVYERWEEVKNYPPELSKRRICQALVKNPRLKQFDPFDLIRSRAFKEFLKAAFKDFTPKELAKFKDDLGMDPKLANLVAEALSKVRLAIRWSNKTLTEKDICEQNEMTRAAMRRMSAWREEVLDHYDEQTDGTLKPRPTGELLIESDWLPARISNSEKGGRKPRQKSAK